MDIITKNKKYLQLIEKSQKQESELSLQTEEKEHQKKRIEFYYECEINRVTRERDKKINEIQIEKEKDTKNIYLELKEKRDSKIQDIDRITEEYREKLSRVIESYDRDNSKIDADATRMENEAKKSYENKLSNLKQRREQVKQQVNIDNQKIKENIETSLKKQKSFDDDILNELYGLEDRLGALLEFFQNPEISKYSFGENHDLLCSIRNYYEAIREISVLKNSYKTTNDYPDWTNYDREKAKIDKSHKEYLESIEANCSKKKEAAKKKYDEEKVCIDKKRIKALESVGTTKKIQEEFGVSLKQRVAEISDKAEMQISKLKEESDTKLNEIQTDKSGKLEVLTKKQGELLNELDDIKKKAKSEIDKFLQEAQLEIDEALKLAEAYSLHGDNVCEEDCLPTTITIGKVIERMQNNELLKTLYKPPYTDLAIPITLDLINGPRNIVINNANNLASDSYLDNIIAGLILKYLEEFPVGALKVGIFDQNGTYCFKALSGVLSEHNKTHKHIVHNVPLNSTDKISEYLKVFTDRSYSFEIYNEYKSNPFDTQMQLVVIRSGFANLCTSDRYNFLGFIRELANTPKYGVRFIIVNDIDSLDQNRATSALTNTLLPEIFKTAVVLDYKSGTISYDGRPATLTTAGKYADDITSYIVNECGKLITKLNQKFSETAIIPYEKIGFGKLRYPEEKDGDTDYSIHIPVGVENGRKTFSLEFSCSGSTFTTAHYTVLGSHRKGKSSMIHSMVINGSMKYTPEELEFWLFDFKNCDTSSKYKNSKVPNIRFLQETNQTNNTSDRDNENLIIDLNSLLNLIKKESTRRAAFFQKLSNQASVSINNIGDYNGYIKKNLSDEYKPMPRIIIALDEPNQIYNFNGGNDYLELQRSIGLSYRHLLTQTGAYGIHFISFVHTIIAGSYDEMYVNNTQGRITFGLNHINPQELRALNDKFLQVQEEIKDLKNGECYVAFSGDGAPRKVKICYTDKHNRYTEKIAAHHKDFKSNILIIGKNEQLTTDDLVQTNKEYTQIGYMQMLSKQNMFINNGVSDELDFRFLVGEDRYSLNPVCINFGQTKVGCFMVCGNKTKLRESVLSSMLLQCVARKFDYHIAYVPPTTENIFTEFCKQLGKDILYGDHNDEELIATYQIFKDRQKAVRNRTMSIDKIKPVFLFVDEPNKVFSNELQLTGQSQANTPISKDNYQKVDATWDKSLDEQFQEVLESLPQIKKLDNLESDAQERIAKANEQNKGKPPFSAATMPNFPQNDYNVENQKQMNMAKNNQNTSNDTLSSTQMLSELKKDGVKYGIFLIISKENLTFDDINDSASLVTLVTNPMNFNDHHGVSADIKQSITSLRNDSAHAVFINTSDEYSKIRPVVFANKEKIKEAIYNI